jgi:hypothetical protein
MVHLEIEDYPPWEFLITNLAGPIERYDMSTLRMSRDGGPHEADLAHQRALFIMIGAIVVSAGHIEAEMKRIVLTHRANPDAGFADVDETWTSLELELIGIASGDSELAEPLSRVLAWGREKRVKDIRDTAVHSAWCLYDIGHLQASRFARKTDGQLRIARHQQLGDYVAVLREYANQLQRLVSWPQAVLPPLAPDAPILDFEVRIAGA